MLLKKPSTHYKLISNEKLLLLERVAVVDTVRISIKYVGLMSGDGGQHTSALVQT